MSCAGCLKVMTSKEFLKCSYCENHYDLECANMTQRSYSSMRQALKDVWKCEACRNKERKGDNKNTPVRSASQLSVPEFGSQESSNVTARRKPSPAPAPASENITEEVCSLDSASLRSLIKQEVKKAISESIGQILKEQLQSTNNILGGFRDTLTSIDSQLENLKSSLAEKTKVIDVLREDNGHLRETVQRLEEHIRQSEQLALSNDVDIVGVPEAKGEATVHVVLTLARKLGVTLSDGDIVSASRVGVARDETTGRARARPIAVRLVRRALRDDLLRAARVRRGVSTGDAGLAGESRRFYVNERLTRENRQLFLRAREIGARLTWRFVWSKDGRVYARQHQSEDSPRHQLRSEADLVRVFGPGAVGVSDRRIVV